MLTSTNTALCDQRESTQSELVESSDEMHLAETTFSAKRKCFSSRLPTTLVVQVKRSVGCVCVPSV